VITITVRVDPYHWLKIQDMATFRLKRIMKKLLKEMVYLGLGTAVVAKHKTEELLENLIKQHHLTRDEGERVVDDMKAQVQRAKQTTDDTNRTLCQQFAEKSHLAEEEIRNLIHDILDKPQKSQEQDQ
jgi:polyhydroxyalkanoate synthesis regulator phasin